MSRTAAPQSDIDGLLDEWAEISGRSRPPGMDVVRRSGGHRLVSALATATAAVVVVALVGVALLLRGTPAAMPATPPPSGVARAEANSHPFRLVFEMPTARWRAGQAIEGTARLELAEGERTTYSGPGSGPLGFGFVEVDGRRDVGPGWRLDCATFELEAGDPVTSGITKSGGWSDDDPDADFYRDFFSDPEVRLPAGEWDITAVALFDQGPGCGGKQHHLRATIRVTIEP